MMRGIQKLAELDSSALLAGGATGAGAYALTSALTRGATEAKRQVMMNAMGDFAKSKSSPLLAGAITALLVGAMVASKMRDKAQQPAPPRVTPQRMTYQNQGFLPGNIVPFPAGHSFYQ